jgi:O-antigen/teichoic acid export membrane protein
LSASHEHEEELLTSEEVRRRAVSGAAMDGIRTLGLRVLTFGGAIVLAHQLTPEDFGLVAVGAAFVTFSSFLSDGGIATALIRRPEPPSRTELKAFFGFQLILTAVLVLVVALVMIPFGLIGEIATLMLLSLPAGAIRVPAMILLERRLNYRMPAMIDLVTTVTTYAWSITTVMIGWGVWGLASGGVVGAVFGTIFLLAFFPAGRIMPSPSWARVRPLLGFGFRYQATSVVVLLRDQGINLTVALIGGVSTLGLYNVAYRIFQVPVLLYGSLWRVSYPGMARLVAAREEMRDTIERVIGVVAVVSGLMLAPLVASAFDLIPAIFGAQWSDAAAVLPGACLTIQVAGPVSVACVGYLWAVGEAGAVLRSTWLGLPFLFAVMIPLLEVIGVGAVGFGWMAAGIVEMIVLIRAVRKHVDITIASRLVPPSLFAVVAALVGWAVTRSISSNLVGGFAAAGIAAGLYLLALWGWHRSYLRDAISLGSQGLRGALGAPAGQ